MFNISSFWCFKTPETHVVCTDYARTMWFLLDFWSFTAQAIQAQVLVMLYAATTGNMCPLCPIYIQVITLCSLSTSFVMSLGGKNYIHLLRPTSQATLQATSQVFLFYFSSNCTKKQHLLSYIYTFYRLLSTHSGLCGLLTCHFHLKHLRFYQCPVVSNTGNM